MCAKQKSLGTSENNSGQNSWAYDVAVSKNAKKNGIELHFNAQPAPELQSKLRAIGFRPSRSQSMWYGVDHKENSDFALKLVSSLAEVPNGPRLDISPSQKSIKANIENKGFSFIQITLREGKVLNYVLFEPSKPKAEVIATQFARQSFRDDFLALVVKPRMYIREARMLFEEGKIISGTKEETIPQPKMEKAESNEQPSTGSLKIALKEILLTTKAEGRQPFFEQGKAFSNWSDADRYAKTLVGGFSDVYFKITWQDNSTHTGWIDLEPADFFRDEENILSNHVKSYFEFLAKTEPNPMYSAKAIKEARNILQKYQLADQILEKPSEVAQAVRVKPFEILNAFHDWLKANGKNDYDDIEQANRQDFENWVKDSKIGLSSEQKDDAWQHHVAFMKGVQKLHSKIHGAPKVQPYSGIFGKLLKIIPGLLEHLQLGTAHGKSDIEPDGGLMVLNYDFLGKDKDGNYRIALAHNYVQNGDVMADPDMQVRIIPEMEAAEALTFQQSNPNVYQEVYEEKDGKQLVNLNLKKQLNSFLNQWLTNLIQQGHKVIFPEGDEHKEEREGKQILPQAGTFLQNIIIPEGVKGPFLSGRFSEYEMAQLIQNKLPGLLQITDETLDEAKPLQLLQLLKMGHPSEYGIKVNRLVLLHEWEKRGKDLFDSFTYPTNINYPYINISLGYRCIEALWDIVEDSAPALIEWWEAAEHYFPISDLETALSAIDKLIDECENKKEPLINPKTKKPTQANLSTFRELGHDIEDLKNSREVIKRYLATSEARSKEDASKDPLTNDYGVFTPTTAGDNYEKIVLNVPKASQFYAEIRIAKTSLGLFTFGVDSTKHFGDASGMSFAPSSEGEQFHSRKEALAAALALQVERIESLLNQKDHILNNEDKKNRNLNLALNAVREFASANDIDLDGDNTLAPVSATNAALNATIIAGLENAYWTAEDEEYPVNKISVSQMDFNQVRLREGLLRKLATLSIENELEIAEECKKRYSERRPIEEYFKSTGTKKKKEDSATRHAIAAYLNDIMLDNGIMLGSPPGAIEFLFTTLFGSADHLTDLPTGLKVIVTAPEIKLNAHDLNKAIEQLIAEKDKDGSTFSAQEKLYILQYTGAGGLIKQGATGKGVLYEYYTPDVIVRKMWDLAYKFGYTNGPVMEPAVGTGNFLKYAPANAVVFGYENNHYSARIAQILYPTAHIQEKTFESLFFAGNIHLKDQFDHMRFSLVIGNPPYGEFSGKYAGMGEKKWTGALEYDQYFTIRGLDLLEKNGLLVFIVPSSFLDYDIKSAKVKEKIASKAELLDAYRLPNRIFDRTDIGTDIVVYKKRNI